MPAPSHRPPSRGLARRLPHRLSRGLRAASRVGLAALLVASSLAAAPRPARAQVGSERYSSVTADAATGTILSASGADEYRFPASLTKMMTLYMLFEALRDRRVGLDQPVPVSVYAASMPPTKLGLTPGAYITVEQALLGLVTKSANDAAAALGELMGGDEDRFAQMMTLRARALGMTRTTFRNASGLPDWEQVTTARDMAVLARRLIQDFPAEYRYFSTPYFVFRGRLHHNHDRLLLTYPGADGLKTGYTTASGFNLVTSAVRGTTRLIGVVMGTSSAAERDVHMTELMDEGFERMGAPPAPPAAVFVRRDPAPLRLPFIAMAQAESASLSRLRATPAEPRPTLVRVAARRARGADDDAPRARGGRVEARAERARPTRRIAAPIVPIAAARAARATAVPPAREAKPAGAAKPAGQTKPAARPAPAQVAVKPSRGRTPG